MVPEAIDYLCIYNAAKSTDGDNEAKELISEANAPCADNFEHISDKDHTIESSNDANNDSGDEEDPFFLYGDDKKSLQPKKKKKSPTTNKQLKQILAACANIKQVFRI